LSLIEATQERWGGAQHLGGATHAVSGVVLVVELVIRVIAVGRAFICFDYNTFRGVRATTLNQSQGSPLQRAVGVGGVAAPAMSPTKGWRPRKPGVASPEEITTIYRHCFYSAVSTRCSTHGAIRRHSSFRIPRAGAALAQRSEHTIHQTLGLSEPSPGPDFTGSSSSPAP
jgi:hypothetical protein